MENLPLIDYFTFLQNISPENLHFIKFSVPVWAEQPYKQTCGKNSSASFSIPKYKQTIIYCN